MKGFTLIELLIVLGIMAILTVIAAPFFASSVGQSELKTTTRELVDAIRRAQTQAMNGNGNSDWGVHVDSAHFVLFKGTTYSGGDPDNVVTTLSSYLSIPAITLSGGGSDVKFTGRKGDTSQYGTIQIQDVNSGQTATVTVSAVGLITYAL